MTALYVEVLYGSLQSLSFHGKKKPPKVTLR